MANDGKDLEELVAFVEKSFSPNLDVKVNQQVFSNGKQIAEFDVEVRGKLGTTEIAWLIQCRDRPSEGPSPGEWIEQLVARRDRFGFNKVTAVSTQGFASGGKEYAEKEGIELREVKSLAPESFDWMGLNYMELHNTIYDCEHVIFNISPDEPKEKQEAFLAVLKNMDGNEAILKSINTGQKIPPKQAFLNAVTQYPKLTENLKPNEEPLKLRIKARYLDEDYFVVETALGEIRIREIEFTGSAKLEVNQVTAEAIQYSNTTTGEVIAQVAAFPFKTQDTKMSLEVHKIQGAEFMQVILRNKGKKMIDEIFKSVKSDLYGRASSPLLGSFIVSWCLCNYKFLMIIFSDLELTHKFRLIDKFMYIHWALTTLQGFIFPLLIALSWIFIYPRIAKPVFVFSKNCQKDLLNIKTTIEDNHILTEKKARALRLEMHALKSSHAKETSDLHQQIDDLKAEFASSNQEKLNSSEDAIELSLPPLPMEYDAKIPENQFNILRVIGKKDQPMLEQKIMDLNLGTAVSINYAIGELEKNNYIRRDYNRSLQGRACELTHRGREYLVKNNY